MIFKNIDKDKLYSAVILSAFLGQAISYSKVYLFHIFTLFAFTYFMTFDIRSITQFKARPVLTSFIAYLFFWCLFSFVFVENKYAGVVGSLQIYSGLFILFFWQLIEDKKFLYKSLYVLLGSHLCIGLIEAFSPFRMPISAVSHLAVHFKKVEPILPSFYKDYPTGFHWHPNNAAFVLVFFSPFVLNAKFIKSKLKALFVILTFVFIIKAGAKAQLALFAFYLFFLIPRYWRFLFGSLRNLLLMGLAVVVVTGLLFMSLSKVQEFEFYGAYDVIADYVVNILSIFKDGKFSVITGAVEERLRFIVGAVGEIKENPLFGLGIGQTVNLKVPVNNIPTSLESIHHYWLEILMIGGASLFIPYILFYLYIFFKNLKAKKFHNTEALVLFFIGVVSISTGIYFLPQWILYCLAYDQMSLDMDLVESV